MLFKTEYFCVQCHQYPGTSYQVNMPYQGSYSRNIGGDTSITCPSHIKQAFLFVDQTTGTGLPVLNCGSDKGSSHNLADIASFLQGRWGFSDTADDINACHACHNPHLATQDYPCSLPSDHASGSAWEVWGDEPGEKMSDYATGGYYLNYYPPYLYPFVVGNPPVGLPPPQPSEWASDSAAPDYVTLCLECHQESQDSTRLGRPLLAINWENGDRHGKKGEPGAAACYYGFRKYPYGSDCLGTSTEYKVVMCTDCHDPHGSPNEFLLRTCVNGQDGLTVPGPGKWWDFCQACHYLTYNPGYHSSSLNCPSCHGHGNYTPFGEGF
jgi:cytochrome c553